MKTRRLPLSSLFLTFLAFLIVLSAQAQVPSYVPTNGLVGYWPFSGNANDESGNGNNGTVNGATPAVDRNNNVNSAYSFDGVDDWIDFNLQNIDMSYSLTFWLYSTLINEEMNFLELFMSSYCQPIPQNKIFYNQGSTTGNTSVSSNYSYVTGTWCNVLFSYDGVNNLQSIYINGELDSVKTVTGTMSSLNSLLLAKRPNNTGYYFGKLDDIGIWNRALTADEVLALYNGCNVTPITIAGSNTPSAFATSTYTCDNNAGSTYNWTVSNGVIASGQGTNSLSILWGAEGAGSVSVVETMADGCVGDAVIYDVNIQCVVSGNAIEGPVGPEAFSNSTYTCNGAANSTYQWTITNGVIVSGQGTNSVTILWASTGLGNVSVFETTYEGCVGTTLSQDVVVIPTNVEELSNALILYPNPATTELNLQTTTNFIGSDLIIFDELGKQIHKQQILSTNTRISTSAFAAGNYVVKVGGVVKRFEVVR